MKENEVAVRPCESKDENAYVEMNLAFMEMIRREHPYWTMLKMPSPDEMRAIFREAMASPAGVTIFIIERAGIPIGYINAWMVYSVWAMGKSMILDDLYICPEYRGGGAGKAVMSYLVNYARDNGFRRLQLHTTMDNVIAQELYKKMGFADEEMIFFMKVL